MHKLQMYEDLRDMLEREVKDIQKKGEMDVQSLDNLYKLMTAIKVTDKCIEREKGEQSGGSSNNSAYGYAGASNVSNDYSMNRGGYSREGGSNDYSRMMPYYAMDGNSMANAANAMANAANAMANASNANAQGRSNERGGSNDGMSNARRGRDGDGDGRYNESRESRDNFRDSSNRRGSYESYDGRSYEYSRDNSRKKMIQKLETLMDDTMSESERRAIMECIEKIK